MNDIGFAAVSTLTTAAVLGSRRWAALAFVAAMLYLTHAQAADVGGISLSPVRILGLVVFVRVLLRGELVAPLNRIDVAVLTVYGYTVLVFLPRSSVDHAYVVGISADAVLSYLAFRALLKDGDDLRWLLRSTALLLVPFVALLSIEMNTRTNPFAVIGGLMFTERDGRLRCMGSFRHPALLGTLGAALLPLYVALMIEGQRRTLAFVGASMCIAIVFFANSGGPISALSVGIIGWALWSQRSRMRLVRYALVVMLLVLALFMKAPLWYLPAKVSSVFGGDGWHRSVLMERAFADIEHWWLAGMDLVRTAEWFDYIVEASGTADITNQFLYFGLTAGLLAMAAFLLLVVSAFGVAGTYVRNADDSSVLYPNVHLVWGLGCCVAVHVSTWFGITYNFDQTFVVWSLQLGALSSLTTAGTSLTHHASSRLVADQGT